jgi:hypothetical protein
MARRTEILRTAFDLGDLFMLFFCLFRRAIKPGTEAQNYRHFLRLFKAVRDLAKLIRKIRQPDLIRIVAMATKSADFA